MEKPVGTVLLSHVVVVVVVVVVGAGAAAGVVGSLL